MKDEEIIADVRHWVKSFVIDMNLCPFAKRELISNRIRFAPTAAQSEAELLMSCPDTMALVVQTGGESGSEPIICVDHEEVVR